MSHIKSYRLIEEVEYQKFVVAINNAIKDGWELHGPTQVIPTSQEEQGEFGNRFICYMTYYYQAMVLLKEAPNAHPL